MDILIRIIICSIIIVNLFAWAFIKDESEKQEDNGDKKD